MTFTPAEGLLVEYKGNVGTIRFIDEIYLTVCLKTKKDNMFGDVCLVVYREEWDSIKLLGGPHK